MITVTLHEEKGTVVSMIGWRRLIQQLRETGEIQPYEVVTHLEIDEKGIRYYVRAAK